MTTQLPGYKTEMQEELNNILHYWATHTVDEKYGGFVGRLNNENEADELAPKGSVLNSRILWSFSAAFHLTQNPLFLQMAARAYQYFVSHFIDPEFGGVFWTVDYMGKPLDAKKQIYAIAFAVYGLSEYAIASGDDNARTQAIALYESIMLHSYDPEYGGYLEALGRDWKELDDLRLSEKDANEKKTMNTHLHVLEAFANLYRIWPDKDLYNNIRNLLKVFTDHIVDAQTGHLLLFFDEQWNAKARTVSYGHDIEASWLLLEAALIIDDKQLVDMLKPICLRMADAASRGLDADGGLWYEYEPDTKHLLHEKHWWPQAEAMVGFMNAWQLSGEDYFLHRSLASWDFSKRHLLDKANGEWFWGVDENYKVMPGQDKVGLWKCPYHNSRACIEIIKRIN